jgi:hypothetical protein
VQAARSRPGGRGDDAADAASSGSSKVSRRTGR